MSLQSYNPYNTTFSTEQFRHAAICISGNTQTLYLDGSAVATVTNNNILSTYSTINQIMIGCAGDRSCGFSGFLDDFRIYSYAMNPSQISNLYMNKNLITYYPFDASTNGTTCNFATLVYDASFIGNASTVSSVLGANALVLQNPNTVNATSYVTSLSSIPLSIQSGLSISFWFDVSGNTNQIMRMFDLGPRLKSKGLYIDISGTNQINSGFYSNYPLSNLEFELTFNAAVAANGLTQSNGASSIVKQLTYGGTGVNTMFSVVSDATRGYVLQCANAANGFQTGYMTVKNMDNTEFRLSPKHTIMFWAKYSYRFGNPNHAVFIGSTSPDPGTNHYHYIMADNVTSKFYTYVKNANATRPTSPHIVNAWFHFACTYDGSTLSTYVNGAFASSSTGGTEFTAGGSIQIGNYLDGYFGTSANFNTVYGWMDNIRIYSTNLSAAQISAIYSYESANPTN